MKKALNIKFSKRAVNILLAAFMALWQLAVPTAAFANNNAGSPQAECSELGLLYLDKIDEIKDDNDNDDDADGDYISEEGHEYFVDVDDHPNPTPSDYTLDPDPKTSGYYDSVPNIDLDSIVHFGKFGGGGGLSHITMCYDEKDESETGKITIVKDAQPNDEQDFDFTHAIGNRGGGFTLDDDAGAVGEDAVNSNTFETGPIETGAHVITEGQVAGWTLDDINCEGGQSIVTDVDNRKVTINLVDDEDVTCTFVNKKKVEEPKKTTLTVVKDTQPDNGQDFTFEVECDKCNYPEFELDDDNDSTLENSKTFDVKPGEYTITETYHPGYEVKEIDCGDADFVWDNDNTVIVDVEEGDDVKCTFTNAEKEEEEPQVDYCDPSQKPGGVSIAQWLSRNQVDGAECFDYEIDSVCGEFDAYFTKNLTPYTYNFRYAVGDKTPDVSNWQGDGELPASFDEDENGGTVTLTYYVVGPEKDYFQGFGIPNIWDGNGVTTDVDTDCEEPTTPQVLADVDEPSVPQTLSVSTLADTGEPEAANNSMFALTIAGAALATVFTRRKETEK